MQPSTHLAPYTFNAAELALLIAVAKDVQHRIEYEYKEEPGAMVFTEFPTIKEDMNALIEDAEGKEHTLISGIDDLASVELEIKAIVAAVLTQGTMGAAEIPGIRARMGKDLPHPIEERRVKELHIKLHEPVRELAYRLYPHR